jgi:hypothetical protein
MTDIQTKRIRIELLRLFFFPIITGLVFSGLTALYLHEFDNRLNRPNSRYETRGIIIEKSNLQLWRKLVRIDYHHKEAFVAISNNKVPKANMLINHSSDKFNSNSFSKIYSGVKSIEPPQEIYVYDTDLSVVYYTVYGSNSREVESQFLIGLKQLAIFLDTDLSEVFVHEISPPLLINESRTLANNQTLRRHMILGVLNGYRAQDSTADFVVRNLVSNLQFYGKNNILELLKSNLLISSESTGRVLFRFFVEPEDIKSVKSNLPIFLNLTNIHLNNQGFYLFFLETDYLIDSLDYSKLGNTLFAFLVGFGISVFYTTRKRN